MKHFIEVIQSWDTLIEVYPCGSRYVLNSPEDIGKSDYDFFISSNDVEAFKVAFPQFEYIKFGCVPLDEFLTATKLDPKEYTDVCTLGIFKAEIDGKKIEVTIKDHKYIDAILRMWRILKDDPDLFRKKYWKRNVSRSEIRKNITALIDCLHIE